MGFNSAFKVLIHVHCVLVSVKHDLTVSPTSSYEPEAQN